MLLPESDYLQSRLAEYLTAAELTKQGLIVAVTSRNAPDVDLLVTDISCRKAWSVQVKKNSGLHRYWPAGERAKEISSDSHLYVFVLLYKDDREPEYFVVPSHIVATHVQALGSDNGFPVSAAQPYKNEWALFNAGSAGGSGEPEPLA